MRCGEKPYWGYCQALSGKTRRAQACQPGATRHLWAESYERDVQDVLLLQSEVAQAVTREIQVAVTPEENRILANARRVNPEAYDAYLKGRFHYWKASPEDLDKALEYYNLALEKDPDYAMAYAHIGDVWGARGCFGFVLPQEALSIGKPVLKQRQNAKDGYPWCYSFMKAKKQA